MNPTYRFGKEDSVLEEKEDDGESSILDRNDLEGSVERGLVVLHEEANPALQAEPLRQNQQPHGDDGDADDNTVDSSRAQPSIGFSCQVL